MELTISQLAGHARVTKDTIFHYEKQGLLLPAARTESNYRIYNDDSLERVKFIKSAQKVGFTLNEVKELLGLKQSKYPCPDAVDYVIRKVQQINKEITKLNNQKDQLQELMRDCDTDDNPQHCEFFNHLANLPCCPTSDLIFCNHSYLYDAANWSLYGNFQLAGEISVGINGTVEVFHESDLWNVNRTLHFADPDRTTRFLNFKIPSGSQELNQQFVAECSEFGDVTGSLCFAGEDIFKSYDFGEHNIVGCEYMKRVHPDFYEARGVLKDAEKPVAWWDYEMTRKGTDLID